LSDIPFPRYSSPRSHPGPAVCSPLGTAAAAVAAIILVALRGNNEPLEVTHG
jgi:hypothetical protein